jgi:adenylate cyclase
MAVEIERKFLIADETWKAAVTRHKRIRQAYLRADGKASIRVRITDDVHAALTIKTSRADLRRHEFEYDIPVLEAEMLMSLREGHVVEKIRHLVPGEGVTWEVDVFEGDNAGLCIAEVELESVGQAIVKPSWVGREVTGEGRYYNGSLAHAPVSNWPADVRAQVVGQ